MTKLTNEQKQQITDMVTSKKDQLKTMSAVATFCNVSETSLSLLMNGRYKTQGDDLWIKVGAALGWKPLESEPGRGWKIVETTDFKILSKTLNEAKNHALFVPISDLAGMGKSSVLKHFADQNQNAGVFYIRCMEWSKGEFLENLCRNLGIDRGRGHKTANDMTNLVIEFFQTRAIIKPLLIIDEADKLKGAALRFLIPFYNELEDIAAVAIAGTENLEAEIKHGVKYHKKGYDEIDSRFGRNYLKLIGCNLKDATAICKANGVGDEDRAKAIFFDCKPIHKDLNHQGKKIVIQVVTDLRRLKRLIKKELLTAASN